MLLQLLMRLNSFGGGREQRWNRKGQGIDLTKLIKEIFNNVFVITKKTESKLAYCCHSFIDSVSLNLARKKGKVTWTDTICGNTKRKH